MRYRQSSMKTEQFWAKLKRFKSFKEKGMIRNFTPHAITVDGVTYPPSGIVARVSVEHQEIVDGCTRASFGFLNFVKDGRGLNPLEDDFDLNGIVIVSAMVFEDRKNDSNPHTCWVAPATGHPDVVRDDKGQIVSVPAFLI